MVALIDADVLLYKFAAGNEESLDWGDMVSHTVDLESAVEALNEFVSDLTERVKAAAVIMVFSGSNNFRYDVDPTYKHNRVNKPPSQLRELIKEYVIENYDTKVFDRLEGDDTMGILSTMFTGKYTICTIDKDLKQIPGRHYNWNTDELFDVTPEEGTRWFHRQILTGDITDGYQGCPGVGAVTAAEFLDDPYLMVPYEHTFSRGKRKGEIEIRYTKEPTDDIWKGIVSIYESKGLTEEDAIRQARLAKMLTVADFNFITEEPILWLPPVSSSSS